jgi:hypothetical protein
VSRRLQRAQRELAEQERAREQLLPRLEQRVMELRMKLDNVEAAKAGDADASGSGRDSLSVGGGDETLPEPPPLSSGVGEAKEGGGAQGLDQSLDGSNSPPSQRGGAKKPGSGRRLRGGK